MNLFGRAITAVTRRKSKTIILLVLFWVIAILILSGFSIVNATKDAGNIARAKLGATLTLSFDRQKAREKADATATTNSASTDGGPGGGRNFFITAVPVTETMANLIKAIPHVKSTNIVESSVAMASGFTAVAPADTSTSSTATTTTRANQNGNNGGPGGEMPSFTQPDLTIIGVSSIDAVTAFVANPPTAKVISTQPLASNSTAKGAYIEQSLAEQNGLKLGSVIKVTAYQSTTVTSLTVVGIYQQTTTTSETSGGGFGRMGNSTFSDPSNTIYVNFYDNVVQTLKTQATAAQAASTTDNRFAQMFTGTAGIDSVSYQVDDPKNVQSVLDAAKKVSGIDWTTFSLSANDAAYKLMMNPIDSISKIASMLIIVVSIAGALILALILALWIKERIYETGVLLSMGEAKFKVVGQYVCEVLIIAVIAFTVAIPSGMLVSKSVANLLMTTVNTTTTSEQSTDNNRNFAGRPGGGFRDFAPGTNLNVTALTVNDLNVDVTGTVVGQLYAMGILIILLATILPAASVMRLNPKTILTKAN